jgi:hypothetical protein
LNAEEPVARNPPKPPASDALERPNEEAKLLPWLGDAA